MKEMAWFAGHVAQLIQSIIQEEVKAKGWWLSGDGGRLDGYQFNRPSLGYAS